MRYFVRPIEDAESGRQTPGGLARIEATGRVEVFNAAWAEWVTTEPVAADITASGGWVPLAERDFEAVAHALIAAQPAATPGAGHESSPRPEEHQVRPQRFDDPVQLQCIQSPDRTLLRFIPVLIGLGVCIWILAAIALSLAMQSNLELATVLSVIVGVATPVLMYFRRRSRLVHEYNHQKRLTLSPAGLHRVDATSDLRISWSRLQGIILTDDLVVRGANIPVAGPAGGLAQAAAAVARSGKAKALLGAGVVAPVCGAPKRGMKVLGLASQPSFAPMGIVFPAEFEKDWQHGTIGAWLRHYRPDIHLD